MRRFFFLFFVILYLSGCQFQSCVHPQLSSPLNSFVSIQDVSKIPQDPEKWINTFDKPTCPTPSAYGDVEAYRKRFFAPWHYKNDGLEEELSRSIGSHARRRLYGPNLHLYSPEVIQDLVYRARVQCVHAVSRYGVMVRDADVRIFPSHLPCFYDACLGGEGYPFDECQNDRWYVGTPVYISHTSTDRGWAYAVSARSQGWVPYTDVAQVRAQDLTRFESLPLATFIKDKKAVYDHHGQFMAYAALGTQLPLKQSTPSDVTVFWPSRDPHGYARWETVRMSPELISPRPLDLTPHNARALFKELMGQPYGWGTYLGHRDCSALTKDYFAVFHTFLARNSKAQSAQGRRIDLKELTPKAKKQRILAEGIPFRTVLYGPGHVGIYVGALNHEPLMVHARWGNKITFHGHEGRNVIGKTVVTTLEWGKELSNLIPQSLFIETLECMCMF